jgi:hypothetical protein
MDVQILNKEVINGCFFFRGEMDSGQGRGR